ncbi:MAG: AMP-binding protein [Rudaea sp.]|nr:AMP-binding protein [Rudaea sp.]
MSAIIKAGKASAPSAPLLADADLARAIASREGRAVAAHDFIAEVLALAAELPDGEFVVNLCEDRYRFLVAFCAVAVAGQTNLLPPSRTPQAIAEVMQAYPYSRVLCERALDPPPPRFFRIPPLCNNVESLPPNMPEIALDQIAAIGFTSGSTGAPKANPKTWRALLASSALNTRLLCRDEIAPNIVATVPPQHMYGLELSILLPLCSRAAIHTGHPFFPGDVAHALADVPAPRMLVTTPFHLRALMQENISLPPLAAIISATAPLESGLAELAEQRHATHVIELFGSTETCVIAHRRTAHEQAWHLYPGVELQPQPDGTLVSAPYFSAPTLLHDIVELLPSRCFMLRGRNGDLLEIAGKRASLGDLTRRLLAIPGVVDGVVFQLDADANGVGRLAALAVADGVVETHILTALRAAVDPVFLPRPLRLVSQLPRNRAGKLPRSALLAALGREP